MNIYYFNCINDELNRNFQISCYYWLKIFYYIVAYTYNAGFSHVYANSKNIEIKTLIFQNDLRYIIKMNINNIVVIFVIYVNKCYKQ